MSADGKTIKDKTSARECSNDEKTFVRLENFEIKTINNLIKATDFDDFISTAETKYVTAQEISDFFLGFFNDPNDFIYLGIIILSYIIFLICNRKIIYEKYKKFKRKRNSQSSTQPSSEPITQSSTQPSLQPSLQPVHPFSLHYQQNYPSNRAYSVNDVNEGILFLHYLILWKY